MVDSSGARDTSYRCLCQSEAAGIDRGRVKESSHGRAISLPLRNGDLRVQTTDDYVI